MTVGFSQLIGAAIVVLVVIFTLNIGGKIYDVGMNIAEMLGLDVGKASIASFSATPSDDGNMELNLKLRGNKIGASLAISRSYKPTPASEPDVVDFTEPNRIYGAYSDRSPKLMEQVNKQSKTLFVKCPHQQDKGCEITQKYDPGWYRFSAVLKKKGKVMDKKDVLTGIYTENYVELLHFPIAGCDDEFGDCNVISCKDKIINFNSFPGTAFKIPDKLKTVAREVSDEFRTERNHLGDSDKCGKTKFTDFVAVGYPNFETSGCSFEDIDRLNTMVSRLRFEQARTYYFDEIQTGFLTLEEAKDIAVDATMSCTEVWSKGRTTATVPAGAYARLDQLGWVQRGSRGKWKSDINTEILKNSDPILTGLKAEVLNDKSIVLTWVPSFGWNALAKGSYRITNNYKKWDNDARDNPSSSASSIESGALSDEVLRTSFSTGNAQLPGRHDFEISVFAGSDAVGNALFTASFQIAGLFDDRYIETYKDGMDGCITKGANGGDGAELHECDVYSQKRKELQALRTPAGRGDREKIIAAYEKSNVNRALCKYEASGVSLYYGLTDGCTPGEVDDVYHNYLTKIGKERDYDCITPLLSSAGDDVCRVKRQVVSSLLKKGWKDFRSNKGWEEKV